MRAPELAEHGGARSSHPGNAMDVQARIDGLVVQIDLQQTFVNTHAEALEATYIFPLPDRAAVTRFRLEVAGRVVEGELKERGIWNEHVRSRLKMAEGSVQGLDELPEEVRAVYRTAWEVPMRSLIDMAADRGAFIDQSQSLNLFIENPNIGQLSSMYFYAWKRGLKTTYYLRSRPATRIAKTTVDRSAPERNDGDPHAVRGYTPTPPAVGPAPEPGSADSVAIACSLENPESCEACQ